MNETQRRLINIAAIVADAKSRLLGQNTPRGLVTSLESFVYGADFFTVPQEGMPNAGILTAPVAVGATAQYTTNIASDSDFLLLYLTCFSTTGAIVGVFNPYTYVQFTDNTTNKSLFSEPVLLPLVTGSGSEPYIMQEAMMLYARSQFVTTLQNLSLTPNYYQFGFSGLKVFYEGGPGL
ncbi:MAG: hypothetical protein V4563_17245 [Pseudomonadota bacterium]